ncbi:Tn3 family transposase [Deinococcus sp. YIM 134068]|uniref:Tn3 family transposase n=1 Tax=Deinococcus lichenicola TaxID=3118910 RepID=UPI003FA425B4
MTASRRLCANRAGCSERILSTLRWLRDPERRRCFLVGLDKGEALHALKRVVALHRSGEIRNRSFPLRRKATAPAASTLSRPPSPCGTRCPWSVSSRPRAPRAAGCPAARRRMCPPELEASRVDGRRRVVAGGRAQRHLRALGE